MNRIKEKSQQLTIFLAKDKASSNEMLLKDPSKLVEKSVQLEPGVSATLFIKKPSPNPPGWATLFAGQVDLSDFGKSSSTGAVLLVRLKKATFMITFGQGRHQLNDFGFERDFGLKVALNAIKPDDIRSIDKATHEHAPLNSRTQCSKGVEILELDIDPQVDLLNGVTGASSIDAFGDSVTGKDALTLKVKIGLGKLSKVLRKAHETYGLKEYLAHFEWVDNLRRVTDKQQIELLNSELVTKLSSSDPAEHCWLGEPDIIDWERVSGFAFSTTQRAAHYPSLRLNRMLQELSGKTSPLSVELLKTQSVLAVDDNFTVVHRWSAYNCLNAEFEVAKEHFMLRNGSWYRIKKNYVQAVNDACSAIPSYHAKLPDYEHDGEGDYNLSVASNDDSYALMDKDLIRHGGGHSSIEFCDLLKDGKDFTHIGEDRPQLVVKTR